MQLPRTAGIYRFWHVPTNQEYIGSTVNFHTRWTAHQRYMRRGEHNQNVQPVYDQFGLDDFCFEILEHVVLPVDATRQESRDILIAIEQNWLDKRKPTLNRCPRANSPAGMRHTEASKAKIIAAHTGMTRSEIAKTNMGAAQKRRYERPEERQKTADLRRGVKASPDARANMSASAQKGIPRSEEVRQKISATLTGHSVSEETRTKIGAANKAIRAQKKLEQ